ncbi:hypothetical protein LRH25_30520 [Ideonella azotifigens]|nr:hypothetical protein [Ideonella azotifigens]
MKLRGTTDCPGTRVFEQEGWTARFGPFLWVFQAIEWLLQSPSENFAGLAEIAKILL